MEAIKVEKHGGPEVIKVATVDKPKPGQGEVLIAVKAAGVNPVDLLISTGNFPHAPPPFISGMDGAGVVAELGEGVTKFKVGDRVWFYQIGCGAFAQFTVCKEQNVGHLAEKVSFEQGSALGVPYNTAHRVLYHKLNVKPGQIIFIHGASGATGIACAQMAYAAGCHVWGTASTEEASNALKAMHVEKVFNHRKEGYLDEVKAATGGKGVDGIIEMMANANLANDLTLLKPGGGVGVIGSKGELTFNPVLLVVAEARVSGVLVFNANEEQQKEAFANIDRGLEAGLLHPIIAKTLPLKEAHVAFQELTTASGRKGKIVLLP